MDYLKESLAPKTLHKVSHVIVIGWFTIGVICLGFFGDTENSESRFDFRCSEAKSENTDFVRGTCFELYERQYNKYGVPIYKFAILNFVLIGLVCAIYSQIVSPIVDDNLLPSARNDGDLEAQSGDEENALSSGKKLFAYYCCQLFARFVLRVLFMILQTRFLYPLDFPSSFSCYLTSEGNQPRNSTSVIQNSTSILHDCHNQRATRKTYWMKALFGMNLLFLFAILIEAVCILVRAWRDNKFKTNSRFVKHYLNPSHGKLQLRKFTENMKKKIKKDTYRPPQLQSPFSSIPGEGPPSKHLTLDQIYTNLVVVPDRAKYDFTGNRRNQLEVYARSGERNTTPRGPEDIINHENKRVLIIGRPGIGKTLCCTKVLRDWARNKIFHNSPNAKIYFESTFFIKFRAFNATTNLSLRELLILTEYSPSDHMDDKVWNNILEKPQRVLLIFDGIDEFKHNSKIGQENYDPQFRAHVDEKMPLFALYEKLVTGKLLDGAAVLTTTRPTALSCIEKIFYNKVFEILGFSPEKVKEYVTKFAEEDAYVRETLWGHIGSNMNILSLCYIPASCFIICSTLIHLLNYNDSKFPSLPTKLTDIYKKAVKVFYMRHNEEFRGKNFTGRDFERDDLLPVVKKKFKKLEKIAFEGIKEGKLIFGESEVRGMENSALFHQLPDRRKSEFEREEQFCFIHLIMQEFFAARHLTNMSETELRNFVSENIEDGKWQLVFQFLAGLINDKEKLRGEIITDLLPADTEEKKSRLYNEEWTVNTKPRKVTVWPTKDKKHLAVTLFKCCGENNEMKETVQRKLQQNNFNCVNFNICQLTAVDCASLITIVKNQGIVNQSGQISSLELTGNDIGRLGCLEICKLLECRNSQLNCLNIASNQLTDEEAKYLADAIRDNNCQLRRLDLSNNIIADKGAQHLAEAINNENCHLGWLILMDNGITEKGAQHLAEAINNENCQLHTLVLTHNDITDKGAQHLAGAINNENCQLHTLDVADNNITEKGAQHLAEAINNENCQLHILDLTHNGITDRGAQHLAEAINNEKCQLHTLDLSDNNITEKGALHLAEAINNENCQLRTLNLDYNNITEAGKQHTKNLLRKGESDCLLYI